MFMNATLDPTINESSPSIQESVADAALKATVVGMIFSVIGTLGNGFFILVLVRVKSLNKPNYRLILGVVIFDLLVNLVWVPLETLQTFIFVRNGRFLGNDAYCVFQTPSFFTTVYTSVFGQFLVAINRATAVFKPIIYRTYMTNRFVSIVFFFVAFGMPAIFFYGSTGWLVGYLIDRKLGDCTFKLMSKVSFNIFTYVINYVPIFGSLFLYVLIIARIIVTTKSNRDEIIQRARGSATMFICSLVLAGCYLPAPISISNGTYRYDFHLQIWINVFFRISFAINPIFYVLFDGQLKKGSMTFLKRFCLRKSSNTEDSMES